MTIVMRINKLFTFDRDINSRKLRDTIKICFGQ